MTKIFQFKNLSVYSYTIFKLKGRKRFSTEDVDKKDICYFDLSSSPWYLYDQNEAATTGKKLDKANVSKYID